jgi:hypothetical protein
VTARALLAPALAAALALAVLTGAGGAAAADPPCFGAAVRDLVHPCANPTRKAYPPPTNVDWLPNSACEPTDEAPEPVCTFGVSPRRARATVALFGDSHALHWRAALRVVANAERWRAYSITTAACFLSAAVDDLPVGLRAPCRSWYRDALRWLKRHPEVRTVFVSQKADTPAVVPPGKTYLDVRAAGFRTTWRGLPKTVKHVVVIRDTPFTTTASLACVKRVVAAATRRPGPACAVPRSFAVTPDTAVQTVKQLHSKRFGSVDLTRYFCGPRHCYPVLGGVLVYNDDLGHITRAYSRSLGPYLLRGVRRLQASWKRRRMGRRDRRRPAVGAAHRPKTADRARTIAPWRTTARARGPSPAQPRPCTGSHPPRRRCMPQRPSEAPASRRERPAPARAHVVRRA